MSLKKTSREHYDIENQVESSHWWFEGRRKILRLFLSRTGTFPNKIAVEVGCGTGANLTVLESMNLLSVGIDKAFYPLNLIREKRNASLLTGDLASLPIKPNSIGLIIAMDVLEHLEDDRRGITECHRALKERGVLFLTVPAFKFLWGIQDDITGHKRRYNIQEIRSKLEEEGFEIMRSTYFNFFLFFPILFARKFIKLFGIRIESENKINPPWINFILKLVFSIESQFLKHLSFPFGVSILCFAQKGRKDAYHPIL